MRPMPEPLGSLRVEPPLAPDEVAFLAGFTREPVALHDGRPVDDAPRTRRLWPGRPRGWSPWAPCAEGCCLVVRDVGSVEVAADWLRFLVHTFLRSGARRAPLAGLGLTFDHSVEGRVWFDVEDGRVRVLSVRRNRVLSEAVELSSGEGRRW